jgi:hypothetical protein
MYGYVRPCKPELKIKDYEKYKSVYCGLCHALRDKYGILSRFAVSYDMTLPALLLIGDSAACCFKRCPISPFRKKRVVCGDPALGKVAALTVILAYHKALDIIADGGFFKKIPGFFIKLYLSRRFKKASAEFPDFAALTERNLAALSEAERSEPTDRNKILDMCADFFANITAGFSALWDDKKHRRITRELFYHIGRAVYLLDAVDDYEKDCSRKNFNPIAVKYGISDGKLPDNIKKEVSETIEMSLASAASAFDLLDANPYIPVVDNIVYLGMRGVLSEVISGNRSKKRKKV